MPFDRTAAAVRRRPSEPIELIGRADAFAAARSPTTCTATAYRMDETGKDGDEFPAT